jgi:hypothetical protein
MACEVRTCEVIFQLTTSHELTQQSPWRVSGFLCFWMLRKLAPDQSPIPCNSNVWFRNLPAALSEQWVNGRCDPNFTLVWHCELRTGETRATQDLRGLPFYSQIQKSTTCEIGGFHASRELYIKTIAGFLSSHVSDTDSWSAGAYQAAPTNLIGSARSSTHESCQPWNIVEYIRGTAVTFSPSPRFFPEDEMSTRKTNMPYGKEASLYYFRYSLIFGDSPVGQLGPQSFKDHTWLYVVWNPGVARLGSTRGTIYRTYKDSVSICRYLFYKPCLTTSQVWRWH